MGALTKKGELYVGNELVPFFSAEQLLKMVEKGRSLLIWNAREGIIWIFVFEIDYEFCELVGFSKFGDGVRKSFPANDGGEIAMGFTVSAER